MLTFTPPPTTAQTQAALSNLPDGFAALGETILAAPGLTADTLLILADGMDAGARERRDLFPGGDAESAAMSRLATILRDAAPRYPHPPREPASLLSARQADAAIRRRAVAAGLATAATGPQHPRGGVPVTAIGGGDA